MAFLQFYLLQVLILSPISPFVGYWISKKEGSGKRQAIAFGVMAFLFALIPAIPIFAAAIGTIGLIVNTVEDWIENDPSEQGSSNTENTSFDSVEYYKQSTIELKEEIKKLEKEIKELKLPKLKANRAELIDLED